uniref:Dolichyl-diphosphooligosaccharide--protein glycosyltransferase subunit 1 n=1 Tax=Tetraselmis sp. GSL018 TaxID=582737 RepID=A0A061SHT3_9CHLO
MEKLLLWILLTRLSTSIGLQPNPDLRISYAERTLKLYPHGGELSEKLTITNTGIKATSGVIFCASERLAAKRSQYTVTEQPSTYAAGGPLKLPSVQVAGSPANVTCNAAILDAVLLSGSYVTVEAHSVLAKASEPCSNRTLGCFEFYDSASVVSPYPVLAQQLKVLLLGPNGSPTENSSETLFGPYFRLPAWKTEPLEIMFSSSKPYLLVSNLDRRISLPLTDSIHVQEFYSVIDGASADPARCSSGVPIDGLRSETMVICAPRGAYLFDFEPKTSNVSFSVSEEKDGAVNVHVMMGVPSFCGHQMDFKLSYRLPSEEYKEQLQGGKQRYLFSLGPIVRGSYIKQLFTEVQIPAGSGEISVPLHPLEASVDPSPGRFLWRLLGRPACRLSLNNVGEATLSDFVLEFMPPGGNVWQRHSFAASAIACLLAIAMSAYFMHGTRKGPMDKSPLQECKRRMLSLISERKKLHSALGSMVESLYSAKDADCAIEGAVALEAKLKTSVEEIGGILADMQSSGSGITEQEAAELSNSEAALDQQHLGFLRSKALSMAGKESPAVPGNDRLCGGGGKGESALQEAFRRAEAARLPFMDEAEQ